MSNNAMLASIGFRVLWLVLGIFLLDFSSKQWVMARFPLGESVPVIPFINLCYTHNSGAAFSFLAHQGSWIRWSLSLMTIVIIIVLLIIVYRLDYRDRTSRIAYSIIIGGALGNLFDRIEYGSVIDFIDFYIGNWHWPTFNIADSFIFLGTLLIIVQGLLHPSYIRTEL